MNPLAYSNKGKDLWTPPWFVGAIEREFGISFVADMAACEQSKVAPVWFDVGKDATVQNWGEILQREDARMDPCDAPSWLFCNPPWNNIEPFLRRCVETSGRAVFVLPSRIEAGWGKWLTDTDLVFVTPRISYIDPETWETKGSPNVGTVLAFLDPDEPGPGCWRRWEVRKP